MEKRSLREWGCRMAVLVVGLAIAHLGVALFMMTDLGADPFNVLIQGLACHLTVSHGVTHMSVCFLIILVLLFVGRSYVKIGTLLCMALGGPIIDAYLWLFGGWINGNTYLPVRIVVVTAACLILAFGMTIVIQSDAGTGPNDLVAVVLADRLHKRFGIVRVIVDASFVLLGMLLGGVFGIGTLICAFVVGTAAGYFMPHTKQMVDRVLKGMKAE